MAILSKIRDRSIALIAVIGLALFAFVLDPSTLTDIFNSTKVNEVGEVNGETISRLEYAEALDTYKTRINGEVSDMQAAKTVWENILKASKTKNFIHVHITGSGDPWGSKIFREKLWDLDLREYPNIAINFKTNGVMLTEKTWNKM